MIVAASARVTGALGSKHFPVEQSLPLMSSSLTATETFLEYHSLFFTSGNDEVVSSLK